MLILDDVLLWIAGEVNKAAQEEVAGEADSLTAELRELYMMLETGRISADEYEAREKALLDRLEELRHEEE